MALKDDKVEQWPWSCGSEFQTWGKKKARESVKAMSLAFVLFVCGCQKKSVVYETECRHVVVQRGKQAPEPFIALKHSIQVEGKDAEVARAAHQFFFLEKQKI